MKPLSKPAHFLKGRGSWKIIWTANFLGSLSYWNCRTGRFFSSKGIIISSTPLLSTASDNAHSSLTDTYLSFSQGLALPIRSGPEPPLSLPLKCISLPGTLTFFLKLKPIPFCLIPHGITKQTEKSIISFPQVWRP